MSYRMSSVFGPGEMDHAIDASEGRSSTTVSVWVEFLLGQDIAAALRAVVRIQLVVVVVKSGERLGVKREGKADKDAVRFGRRRNGWETRSLGAVRGRARGAINPRTRLGEGCVSANQGGGV